jgi:hypothetical protein
MSKRSAARAAVVGNSERAPSGPARQGQEREG